MAESSQAGAPSDLPAPRPIDLKDRKNRFLLEVLVYAQERLRENQAFRKHELRSAVRYMYPDFQEDDKKKLNEMNHNFYQRNALTIGLSAVNVFLVAAYFKSAVFFTSYELGMYYPKRNMREFKTNLMLKYKEEFLSKNLNINK